MHMGLAPSSEWSVDVSKKKHRFASEAALELAWYNIQGLNDFYMKLRPDPGLVLLKCSELTRGRHGAGFKGRQKTCAGGISRADIEKVVIPGLLDNNPAISGSRDCSTIIQGLFDPGIAR